VVLSGKQLLRVKLLVLIRHAAGPRWFSS
jgi:hypothetical protein